MPPGLLPRLDDVWYENFAAWARAHPAGVAGEREGWRIASLGSPWPFYNVATAVSEGFEESGGDPAVLDQAFAAATGYRVWLRDGMDAAEVSLKGAGFEAIDEIPALWMPLTELASPAAPEGYTMLRAESDDDVVACILGDRWAGYMNDGDVTATFPDPAAMARERDRRFYLARRGDRLVATGQTVAVGGVVGVYGMWTAEEHRRHGLGTAILMQALGDSASAGVEYAHIQASSAGVGIYRRAGFRDYGQYRIYRPPLEVL